MRVSKIGVILIIVYDFYHFLINDNLNWTLVNFYSSIYYSDFDIMSVVVDCNEEVVVGNDDSNIVSNVLGNSVDMP